MARIPLNGDDNVEFMRIFGYLPELRKKWTELESVLLYSGALSPRLKHRVQTGLADKANCRFCLSMAGPPKDGYDRQESLAVAFAQLVQIDPPSISQQHFDDLLGEFTVEQVVELCVVIGFLLGGLTLGAIWDLAPGPPEMKDAYDEVVDQADERWRASTGYDGSGSLWKQNLDRAAGS